MGASIPEGITILHNPCKLRLMQRCASITA